MSYFLEVKNRAVSSLASDVTDVATTWTLATGEGAKFPASGDFHVTCEDEIVKVTARSTDTLTVTRAQEGTTGAAHTAGKAVELRITAGIITEIQGKKAIAGWTANKLLKGAGAGADPTEIDAPAGAYTQGARVRHNAQQTIPNTTWTTLAFNTQLYDTDTIHDPVTNNSRLTCKTAGKYIITAVLGHSSATSGTIWAMIKLNGASNISSVQTTLNIGADPYFVLTAIWNMVVNDYVEVAVCQSSGAAGYLRSAAYRSPEFMMQRIG